MNEPSFVMVGALVRDGRGKVLLIALPVEAGNFPRGGGRKGSKKGFWSLPPRSGGADPAPELRRCQTKKIPSQSATC